MPEAVVNGDRGFALLPILASHINCHLEALPPIDLYDMPYHSRVNGKFC